MLSEEGLHKQAASEAIAALARQEMYRGLKKSRLGPLCFF